MHLHEDVQELLDLMHHLFLSPHLDDAALSAGGLIDGLTARGENVTIATLATADHDPTLPLSTLVEDAHKRWNLGHWPYRLRRQEDMESCRILKANYRHGNLRDAIYRRMQSDRGPLYEDRQMLFQGAVVEGDDAVSDFAATIDQWIAEMRPDRLYLPLGVGRHVDHIAANLAAQQVVRRHGIDTWLYEDFPYVAGKHPAHAPDSLDAARRRSTWKLRNPEQVPIRLGAKFAAVEAFSSQVAVIFNPPTDARRQIEDYALSVGAGSAAERFWPAG